MNDFTFLSNLTIDDLKDRINKFQCNDFPSLTPADIDRMVFQLFAVNNRINQNLYRASLPVSTFFYRVRKIKDYEDLLTEQGFWYNPSPQLGRLNLDNEPLLYACFNHDKADPVETAICKAEITPNDLFAIICYESIKIITYAPIGLIDYVQINPEEYEKHLLVENFLEKTFVAKVDTKARHYCYHIARAIAKRYFGFDRNSFGTKFCDAIVYPSSKNNVYNNICLQIEPATKKLKLRGAAIATTAIDPLRKKTKFSVLQLAQRLNEETCFFEISKEILHYILPKYTSSQYGT